MVDEAEDWPARRAFCAAHGLSYVVIADDKLSGFPVTAPPPSPTTSTSAAGGRMKVLVTGCYDWLHTGHVRFFEEVAELGELYVVVGHDANITLLKGPGHPLYGQEERRYMVGAIRYVHEARIATGDGWLDAEPEIRQIQPDSYVVNEDGDRPEKRDYCRAAASSIACWYAFPKTACRGGRARHCEAFDERLDSITSAKGHTIVTRSISEGGTARDSV